MPTVIFTSASGTWTCPKGVQKLQVQVWGGGGVGGGGTGNPAGGGGGAGGNYARSWLSVVPSSGYAYVAAPATAGATSSNNVRGKGSRFHGDTVFASGGPGGALASISNTSGAGGVIISAEATGDFTAAGGNGGTGVAGTNAGGGGEAGAGQGTGAAGGADSAGSGSTDGGNGGAPGISTGNGSAGTAGSSPGGGGGGGRAGSNTDRAGGGGAVGQVQLQYLSPCTHLLLGIGS